MIFLIKYLWYYLAGSAGAGLGGAGGRGRGRAAETGRAPGTSPCSLAPATQPVQIIYSWLSQSLDPD
jgi:hypothetical protein